MEKKKKYNTATTTTATTTTATPTIDDDGDDKYGIFIETLRETFQAKNDKDHADVGTSTKTVISQIAVTPERVQGYKGKEGNMLKLSSKQFLYFYNNLIIIFDLWNQNQTIFSKHKNEVFLIRCKENNRNILSGEYIKNKIKIFLWDKYTLEIIGKIKIKKQNFLDITFLDETHILLLCKYYDRLVLFLFSVSYESEKVALLIKYVNVIKKINDLHIKFHAKKSRRHKQKKKQCVKWIHRGKLYFCKDFSKNVNGKTYNSDIMRWGKSRTKSLAKEKGEEKEKAKEKEKEKEKEKSFKEKNKLIKYVKLRKYKNENYFLYDIIFKNGIQKDRKRNLILQNFKLYVCTNKKIYVFSKEYILLYQFKGLTLYEKKQKTRFKCHCSSPKCSSYISFFRKRSRCLFHLKEATAFVEQLFYNHQKEDLPKIKEDANSSQKEKKIEEEMKKEGNSEKLTEQEKTKSEAENETLNSTIFSDLKNCEIKTVDIINLLELQEDDDIDILFNLCSTIENLNTFENPMKYRNGTVDAFSTFKGMPYKTYILIGTTNGFVFILNASKPHIILHLEKISSHSIIFCCVFKNDLFILDSAGNCFFLDTSTFNVLESFNLFFCPYNDMDRMGSELLPIGSNGLIKFALNKTRKIYTPCNNTKSEMNTNRKGVAPFISSADKKNYIHKEKNKYGTYMKSIKSVGNVGYKDAINVLERQRYSVLENAKQVIQDGFLKKKILCCCLVNISLLVIGTSDDEIILFDLVHNTNCSICTYNKEITYFTFLHNHIIFNVKNVLYKMDLVNYYPYIFLILPRMCVSCFLFYSDTVLICGTYNGCLYFFDITTTPKLINKYEKKSFRENETYIRNRSRPFQNETSFYFMKKVAKGKYHTQIKHPQEEKQQCIQKNRETKDNQMIRDLLMNKSKTCLVCAFKNEILIFKLLVNGIKKVNIKLMRSINIHNIIHISLINKYDNLFYVTSKEEKEQCYTHQLYAFNLLKPQRKLNALYYNILNKNTWIFDFYYYNDEHFLLEEKEGGDMGSKNQCILLNKNTFLVYSYKLTEMEPTKKDEWKLDEPEVCLEKTSNKQKNDFVSVSETKTDGNINRQQHNFEKSLRKSSGSHKNEFECDVSSVGNKKESKQMLAVSKNESKKNSFCKVLERKQITRLVKEDKNKKEITGQLLNRQTLTEKKEKIKKETIHNRLLMTKNVKKTQQINVKKVEMMKEKKKLPIEENGDNMLRQKKESQLKQRKILLKANKAKLLKMEPSVKEKKVWEVLEKKKKVEEHRKIVLKPIQNKEFVKCEKKESLTKQFAKHKYARCVEKAKIPLETKKNVKENTDIKRKNPSGNMRKETKLKPLYKKEKPIFSDNLDKKKKLVSTVSRDICMEVNTQEKENLCIEKEIKKLKDASHISQNKDVAHKYKEYTIDKRNDVAKEKNITPYIKYAFLKNLIRKRSNRNYMYEHKLSDEKKNYQNISKNKEKPNHNIQYETIIRTSHVTSSENFSDKNVKGNSIKTNLKKDYIINTNQKHSVQEKKNNCHLVRNVAEHKKCTL